MAPSFSKRSPTAGHLIENFSRRSQNAQSALKRSTSTSLNLYDASAKKIRAWVIFSDGSWSQAEVTVNDGVVQLDAKGAGPDGRTLALISTLRLVDLNTRSEEWTAIQVDGKDQPSPPPILWKREPARDSA